MMKLCAIALITSASIGFAPPVDDKAHDNSNTETSVLELVKRLDADAKRRYYSSHNEKTNDFEAVLQKIIRHGEKAEKPLSFKLKHEASMIVEAQKRLEKIQGTDEFLTQREYWKESEEVDRLSNNLELVTALRRVQERPDPLFIRVTLPKDLKAIPGRLPSFFVKLKSVDIEQTPVWVQLIPHFHGSRREAQWRFEVRNPAGDLLPVRPNTQRIRIGGGIKSDGWLRFGESLDTVLPMGDFIEIPEPGEYTVTVMYHPKLPIADITNVDELDELIVFRSQSFKLTVGKGPRLAIESSKADRAKVLSLVAEMPNEGVVKIVGGVYDEDDHAFVSPESPAGQILTLNWQAVPALLDSLSEEMFTLHRKAWVLSLLYTITLEHELNPIRFQRALPDYDGQAAGKNTLGADLSGDSRIIPHKQQLLITKWRKFRDEYLDIRESTDK